MPRRSRRIPKLEASVVEKRSDPFQKTKMCKFHILGVCMKGEGCQFAHAREELNALPDLFRTKLCKTLINTGCCEDPNCKYAHNKEELRSPGLPRSDRSDRLGDSEDGGPGSTDVPDQALDFVGPGYFAGGPAPVQTFPVPPKGAKAKKQVKQGPSFDDSGHVATSKAQGGGDAKAHPTRRRMLQNMPLRVTAVAGHAGAVQMSGGRPELALCGSQMPQGTCQMFLPVADHATSAADHDRGYTFQQAGHLEQAQMMMVMMPSSMMQEAEVRNYPSSVPPGTFDPSNQYNSYHGALPIGGYPTQPKVAPPTPVLGLAEMLGAQDCSVKNTFLNFAVDQPKLRNVQTAAGRLDLMAAQESPNEY